VAPTDPLPVVRYDTKAGERSLDVMRWGLVPFWAKDIKVGFANINAKAEGIESRPAFREAFQRRRCLVPVDNFYEWKKTATGNLHSWLAAVFVMLALAGCAPVATEQGRAPYAPYSRDNEGMNRSPDM
jgi:putative SOS response-associated peptidase YedK